MQAQAHFLTESFPCTRCRGNLPEILGYDETAELLKESDDIYLKFGADQNVYGIDKQAEIEEIRRKAINANLKLIECPIRHLGTEEGYKIYTRLQEHLLAQGVTMEFNTMVKDIIIEEDRVKGVLTDKDETCYALRSFLPLAVKAQTGSHTSAGTTGSRPR